MTLTTLPQTDANLHKQIARSLPGSTALFASLWAWLRTLVKSAKKRLWTFSVRHPLLSYWGVLLGLPLLILGAVSLAAALVMLPIGLIFGW